MKKSLLFLLALSIGLFAVAQERNLSSIKLIDQINDLPDQAFPEPESTIGYNEISPSGIKATTEFNLMKTDIATSANVYSLLLSRQTTLVYCQQLGMLVFAHRAGGPSGNTGDELRINWTFNAGESWEHLIVTDPSGLAMRYPSVAIYNPEGNTDPNNAFFLFSTPMTDAAGWADVAIGSIRLDGEHLNIDYVGENPETTGSFYREGIQVFPDGSAYVAARVGAQDVANPYRGRIMTGQFNADDNLFEWNEPFDIDIQHIAEEYWTGADKFTFSPDGSVGYYVAHGIEDDADVNPYRVRHPIVFKSTDKGNTWEKVEYEPLHNVYFEELWPTLANEDLYIPQFWAGYIGQQYDYGYTVDAYGNLHMLASAVGVYSVHPDSTGFSFTFEPEKLYHMMLNNDGVWTAQYLDSLKTAVVEGSPYGADWTHRIQLARSADGTKVFASWMDTDFEGQEQNLFPDVFVYGRDVNTNLYTDVINATYFTNYWLENFWMYLTDMVLSGDGQYHVPVTTSVPGDTDLDPLMNQLMTGMIFEEADFTIVSIDTPAEMNTSKFEVSQAYPNPAKDYAFIDVTIENNANISVSISNLIGQTVWQSGVNEVAAGKHQLQLNTSDLNAGIYIYNVKVNDNVVSKKLIVN